MKKPKLGMNVLGLVAVVLVILAMLVPWWSFSLQLSRPTNLYPYLVDGPASEFVGYKRSAQMTLLTGFLGLCIVLGLVGCVSRGRLSRVLLAVSGAGILLGTWRLLVRVQGVAARFGIPIQGEGIADYMGFAQIEVWSRIRPGLYLVILGGVLFLAASLLHSRVRVQEWDAVG